MGECIEGCWLEGRTCSLAGCAFVIRAIQAVLLVVSAVG